MREIQVGFGVANEGDLVSEMRGLPSTGPLRCRRWIFGFLPALRTLHSGFYTPHFTLPTLHAGLHTRQSNSKHTVDATLYTLNFTLHTLHFTLYAWHSTPYFRFYTWYPHTCVFHAYHPAKLAFVFFPWPSGLCFDVWQRAFDICERQTRLALAPSWVC